MSVTPTVSPRSTLPEDGQEGFPVAAVVPSQSIISSKQFRKSRFQGQLA